jgi:hypothetical protein
VARCSECRFLQTYDKQSIESRANVGKCHRNPTSQMVDLNYWCGEFIEAPKAAKAVDRTKGKVNAN